MDILSIAEIFIKTVHAAEEAGHAAEGSGGIAAMFGLSGKLFIAQLVNFGIVLFVLWKWVFGPVTRALEKRTQKIEQSLVTAKQVEDERVNFETWRKEEISKARKEASEIITKAQSEAEVVKSNLLEQTKVEQQRVVDKAKAEVAQESAKAIESAKQELAHLVVQATEKIIREKLDEKKDKALIASALQSVK